MSFDKVGKFCYVFIGDFVIKYVTGITTVKYVWISPTTKYRTYRADTQIVIKVMVQNMDIVKADGCIYPWYEIKIDRPCTDLVKLQSIYSHNGRLTRADLSRVHAFVDDLLW